MSAKKDKQTVSASHGSIAINGAVQGNSTVFLGGDMIVGNHNTITKHTLGVDQLFREIESAVVEQIPDPADQADVQAELAEIQTELKKEEPDEGFLARRFRNIKRMSPEIVEVALKTLQNPVGGVVEVIKRISKKMAEEAQ